MRQDGTRKGGLRKSGSMSSAGTDSLRLDRQLCFSLYSAQLAMTRAYRPLLEGLGLTYPQYLVLLALWEGDGETVSGLSDRLCLDSGTLTPLLVRLEEQRLVRRERGAQDARQVLIHLTAAGRSLEERAVAVRTQVMDATGLSARGLDDLKVQLLALRARLSAAEGEAEV
jgi:DNA-binding MarR family transcriptional regulator